MSDYSPSPLWKHILAKLKGGEGICSDCGGVKFDEEGSCLKCGTSRTDAPLEIGHHANPKP